MTFDQVFADDTTRRPLPGPDRALALAPGPLDQLSGIAGIAIVPRRSAPWHTARRHRRA